MPDMNWVTTGREVRWILRDRATGQENMDVHWRFKQGDVVKIRVTNDARSLHPMSHPIHLHGQRFLVVAKDGGRTTNFLEGHICAVVRRRPAGRDVNAGTWRRSATARNISNGMMSWSP